jgi:hypothetical protein
MKKQIFSAIKWISTILIVSAIGLELWKIHGGVIEPQMSILIPISIFGRFALTIHCIEVVIACIYAPASQKPPIQYGIYTFFAGTIALVELFDQRKADTAC